jgi:hypothetical protein
MEVRLRLPFIIYRTLKPFCSSHLLRFVFCSGIGFRMNFKKDKFTQVEGSWT